MKKILFTGVPGSGKGTQAKLLEKYGFKHVSTGDLIRRAWQDNNPKIILYKKKIEAGGFLPDKLIFELIEKNISEPPKYILDGAARTRSQAKFVIEKNLIDTVVHFSLTEDQAIERLKKRQEIEKRSDDNEEAIKVRFEEYRKKSEPLLQYLKENIKNYFEVDASPSIEEIHEEVLKILRLK